MLVDVGFRVDSSLDPLIGWSPVDVYDPKNATSLAPCGLGGAVE